MKHVGIICEYNPLHLGHKKQIDMIRAADPDGIIVCLMSGNYVQRGDFALVRKHARAQAAVESGVDLVLDERALGRIQKFFDRIGRKMTENNVKQAMVPATNGIVLYNDNGSMRFMEEVLGKKINSVEELVNMSKEGDLQTGNNATTGDNMLDAVLNSHVHMEKGADTLKNAEYQYNNQLSGRISNIVNIGGKQTRIAAIRNSGADTAMTVELEDGTVTDESGHSASCTVTVNHAADSVTLDKQQAAYSSKLNQLKLLFPIEMR